MGFDTLERERAVLLVLPRGDEALKAIDEHDEPPEDAEQGYAIRAMQVEDSLREARPASILVLFFNAMEEDPPGVWSSLCNQIAAMRSRQLERLQWFVALSHELDTDTDATLIEEPRRTLAKQARQIAAGYRPLPNVVRAAHQRLLDELRISYPSSIAPAAARR